MTTKKKHLLVGTRKLIKSVIDNDFFGMASEMGFMMVIGIFPFMLFLMAVFGWLGHKATMNSFLVFLGNFMPAQAINLIKSVLNEVMIFSNADIMAIIGLVVTLFLSTNSIAIVLKGLNRAYNVEETRNFVYTRILSFIMVIIDTLVLFLSINLIVFGKVIINMLVGFVHLPIPTADLILVLRWPIAFSSLFIMAFLSYYVLPDLKGKESFKMKSALPGTCFFCIFWLIGSGGFSVYVNHLNTYNMVYGTIGAFAVLMIWLYYTSILILVGGQINSQVYNRLEKKAVEIQEDLDEIKNKK
ncbi:YihY/virulence factor BrkB family protein [bacterium]|nr:YihY/virulence factor BrkB family protein [bacterium]